MTPSLRLAIDATPLLGPQTGVARVTRGLVEGLSTRADIDAVAYAVTWRGREQLRERLPGRVAASSAPIPARLARALWLHTDVPRIERWTGRVDIVHGTSFVGPPARAPVVVTVHDLTFADFPEMCDPPTLQFDRLLRRALDRGATIHAVSDFVAGQVREHFGLEPERVVRIYAGLVDAATGSPERGRRLAGSDRFALALGTIEPRKNLPTLVRAFDLAAARDRELRLVLAGPDGWGVSELESALGAAAHQDRIARLGFVSDADRQDLLSGATVFAYPSYYEGFGHPPLEAMSAGIPVVAANAGALPEVLGDAAVLVAPTDTEALADALARVAGDEDLRSELRLRGLARVERYTWDRAVDEFVTLYRKVAA